MNIHAKWPSLIEYMTTCLKVFVVIHLCPADVTYPVRRQDLSFISLHYINKNQLQVWNALCNPCEVLL